MKKIILLAVLLLTSLPCFSQIVNSYYFCKDNVIDNQFEIENQNWTNNYEWQLLIGKYTDIWKNQVILEIERLISLIPEKENEIRKNQENWEKQLEKDFSLVFENIDSNKIGRENFIGLSVEKMLLYRNRAVYFFCLYYTIKDQTTDFLPYTDMNEPELAGN